MSGSKFTPLATLHDSRPVSWLSVPTSTRICFTPRAPPIQRFVNKIMCSPYAAWRPVISPDPYRLLSVFVDADSLNKLLPFLYPLSPHTNFIYCIIIYSINRDMILILMCRIFRFSWQPNA